MYRILMAHHGRRTLGRHVPPALRSGRRGYLHTFHPADDAAAITPPADLFARLDDVGSS